MSSQLYVATCAQCLARRDALFIVHRQQANRRPPLSSTPNDFNADPVEVVSPSIKSGIEQQHNRVGFRVDRGEIRSLVSVAVRTSQGQIVRVVAAAVLLGPNVLDVKGEKRRGRLGQLAVLASFARSLPHELASRSVYQEAAFRFRRVRALACNCVMK